MFYVYSNASNCTYRNDGHLDSRTMTISYHLSLCICIPLYLRNISRDRKCWVSVSSTGRSSDIRVARSALALDFSAIIAVRTIVCDVTIWHGMLLRYCNSLTHVLGCSCRYRTVRAYAYRTLCNSVMKRSSVHTCDVTLHALSHDTYPSRSHPV